MVVYDDIIIIIYTATMAGHCTEVHSLLIIQSIVSKLKLEMSCMIASTLIINFSTFGVTFQLPSYINIIGLYILGVIKLSKISVAPLAMV